jgi:methylthioribulose-1-phosphate dehydratase
MSRGAVANASTAVQEELVAELVAVARRIGQRGWLPATSGNLSAVVSREPLLLAATATGVDKTRLQPSDVVLVDESGRAVDGGPRPSAEVMLHVAVARATGAGAVVHTHSVWDTLASLRPAGQVTLAGFELLKALDGVDTHEHRELLPIFDNDQNIERLAARVETALGERPDAHAFLLRAHGMYAWGADLAAAERHLDALQLLLEVTGRAEEPT